MRKIKKTIIGLLMVLCTFVLVGWGKKAVDLLNDTPLIDLNKAIQEAPIGSQGNTLMGEENETKSESTAAREERETSSDKKTETVREEKKEPYKIKIRDMTITYRNKVCDSMDNLKDRLISDCSDGKDSVYLQDDFAEAHVYEEVLAILEQLHETKGLEYTAD